MALTVSNLQFGSSGDRRRNTATVTFDNSYATGGESLTAAMMGLKVIDSLDIEVADGYLMEYDSGNSKIKVFRSAGFTPSGTNAASNVDAMYGGLDDAADGITKPGPALTHNADPVANLAAAQLYVVEARGNGSFAGNIGSLQSNQASAASTSFVTDSGSIYGVSATWYGWCTHNASPAGVKVYVNESASDRLECVSPTASDVFVILAPVLSLTNASDAPGTDRAFVPSALSVKIHHNASASGGTGRVPLYYDDNGAADAKLAFVDTGAAGGVIPAADIQVLVPLFADPSVDGKSGTAAAQTFTGAAVGAAALTEVSAATNLSTVAVRVTAIGY